MELLIEFTELARRTARIDLTELADHLREQGRAIPDASTAHVLAALGEEDYLDYVSAHDISNGEVESRAVVDVVDASNSDITIYRGNSPAVQLDDVSWKRILDALECAAADQRDTAAPWCSHCLNAPGLLCDDHERQGHRADTWDALRVMIQAQLGWDTALTTTAEELYA